MENREQQELDEGELDQSGAQQERRRRNKVDDPLAVQEPAAIPADKDGRDGPPPGPRSPREPWLGGG
jgi:hypothetical protein